MFGFLFLLVTTIDIQTLFVSRVQVIEAEVKPTGSTAVSKLDDMFVDINPTLTFFSHSTKVHVPIHCPMVVADTTRTLCPVAPSEMPLR